MKTLLVAVAAAVASVAGVTPAHAVPMANTGAHINYVFESDSALNNVSYYSANGRVYNGQKVRFFLGSDGTYRYGVRFNATRPQKAASVIQSMGGWARCTVYVGGRVANRGSRTGTVPMADCGFPVGVDPDY